VRRLFIASRATLKREETRALDRYIYLRSRYTNRQSPIHCRSLFSLSCQEVAEIVFAIGAHPILEGSARWTHQTGKRLDGHQTQHFSRHYVPGTDKQEFFRARAYSRIVDVSAWPSSGAV
jgi:hypothetical protein